MATLSQLQTDLANVEAGIRALVASDRPVQITFDGRTVSYDPAKIDKLRALKKELQQEIADATPGGTVNFVTFRRPSY